MIKTQIFELGNQSAEVTGGPEFGMFTKQTKTVSDTIAVTVFNTEKEFHDLITDPSRFRLTIKESNDNAEKVYSRLVRTFIRRGEPFMVSSFPIQGEASHKTGITHIFVCIDTAEEAPSSLIISKLVGRYLGILVGKTPISKTDVIVFQILVRRFCEESKEFLAEVDKLWERSVELEGKA